MLSPDQQQELLDNVVEEFTERLRIGERPAIDEYKRMYPSISEEIDELLTSVAMIEELKTQSSSTANSFKREMKEILQLDQIGDYRIIRELGRGGMGIVFEAVHESLGRRVAIKVMPNRTFDDQKYLERFKREAHAAANLHHTNIVSVFGIGETAGHHYYVMEFVDGESLSSIISRLNEMNESITKNGLNTETIPAQSLLPTSETDQGRKKSASRHLFDSPKERFRWAAELGSQVADGLAYAHGLGMLHRDIKPSNLLVDKHDTVWLTDFGLVKNISNISITKTGDIIGTPQYMAPESFEGNYDERSETYCLGLTLYEMVTLKPAYENASTPELIRRVTTSSPLPPRKYDHRVPRDLNRIIQKAISREPGYRYQQAIDMRNDLRAFLDDRPISARRISMSENIWRWSRRNPVPAALSLLTSLMICAIAIGATVMLTINNRALIVSKENENSAKVERRVASYARLKAEQTLMFTVESYDKMFRDMVLKGSQSSGDVSLDGFADLEGISTTVTETDAEFLEQMLQFYVDFAEENKDYAQLTELTAKSFRRVANIYHLTGQFDEAVAAYDKSIAVYTSINKASPESIPDVLEFANTINEKGRAIELQGRPKCRERAVAEHNRAIELLRNHPSHADTQLRVELAKSLILVGTPPVAFRPHLPENFVELEKWVPATWFSSRPQNSWNLLSEYKIAKPIESLTAIKEANAIADGLMSERKNDSKFKFLKAMALTRLSTLQVATRRLNASQKSLLKAEDYLAQLLEQYPESAEYKFALAQNHAIPRGRNVAKTIESMKKSKRILIGLASRYNRNLDYQRFLADVCLRLGLLLQSQNEIERAEKSFEMAYETFRTLMPVTPRSRSIQATGFACFLQYIDLLVTNGKTDKAIVCVENAIEDLYSLSRSSDEKLPMHFYNRKSVCLYSVLALIHKESGDFSEAIRAKRNALDMMDQSSWWRRIPAGKNNPRSLARTPN